MDDKTFELLEKMYAEFRTELNDLKSGQNDLKSGQKKIEAILEQDFKKDISALYDGYKQIYEKLEVIEDKVDHLSDKVDKHDIKIQVIEGGRK
jgi:uncharacterized phage infection (PIP) family protein YhgE